MVVVRYSRWDGSQRANLHAGELFERFADHLWQTDDVARAIERMKRRGVELDDGRLPGLDDVMERLRQAMRARRREFNLNDALSEIRRELEQLLQIERKKLGQTHQHESADAEENELAGPKRRLAEMIRALRGRHFRDAEAKARFDRLADEHPNVRDLENFIERSSHLFKGPKSLGYRDALALMREMEEMRRLESALAAGDFQAMRAESIRELLGQEASREIENLHEATSALSETGYLLQRGGLLRLSPKGIRRIGQLALRDIFRRLAKDRAGLHSTDRRGAAEIRLEESKSYTYGDALNLDLAATLKNAIARNCELPLKLMPADFAVYESDSSSSASTVLCLDMSWSMSWDGRFAGAKRVAIALETLIRSAYPRDYFAVVGFFTHAVELRMEDLAEATWNMGDPFTNLQGGLRLACALLERHPSHNQNIIVITDGQPTAYFLNGQVCCEWPLSFGGISSRAAEETLKEVERLTRKRITINTFMLDDAPALRAFVDEMARRNRGRAFYSRPASLGEYLVVDYLAHTRKRL